MFIRHVSLPLFLVSSFLQYMPSPWAGSAHADTVLELTRTAKQERRKIFQRDPVFSSNNTVSIWSLPPTVSCWVRSVAMQMPALVINLDRRPDRFQYMIFSRK